MEVKEVVDRVVSVEGSRVIPPGTSSDLKPACDRLTCQFALHHEHCGEMPVSVNSHFSALLNTVDQPYIRRLRLSGTDWERFDFGWLKNPGMIVVENRAGAGMQVVPTTEELELSRNQVLLVKLDDSPLAIPWVVRPGRFMVGEIEHLGIWLRCMLGPINVNLTVMPR